MKKEIKLDFYEYCTKSKECLEDFLEKKDFGPHKTLNSEMQNFCSIVEFIDIEYPELISNTEIARLKTFMEVFLLRLESKENPPRELRIKNIIKILIDVFDNFAKNEIKLPITFFGSYKELRYY